MTLTLSPSEQIVSIVSSKCRVWHGRTDAGTKVIVFIPLLAAQADTPQADLERELRSLPTPTIVPNFGAVLSRNAP